jgi:RNA-directed DNA polymerase
MSLQQYADAFEKKALQSGFSQDEINRCLKYAEPLIKGKLPVIYNTTHLAALVGYKKIYLKKAVLYSNYFYRKFIISKRNGKPRKIAEPLPSLKEIQLWILNNILENIKVSKFAKAYLPKKDIKDNAKYHIDKPVVLKVDIKDFFGSISQESVEQIFLNLKYSSNISNLLSKLCTLNNCLPQGASTSPYLSNIYLKDFDGFIGKHATDNDIRYTRYADDMTFSGDFVPEITLDLVKGELIKLKLTINDAKTVIMRQNTRQLVTGIVVNKKMQVPRKDRQNMRLEIYYLKKYGLVEHLKAVNNKKSNYIPHLLGRLNFFLNINSKDEEFIEYKKFVIENFASSGQ